MKVIILLIRASAWKFVLAAIASFISGTSLSAIIYLINEAISTKMEDPSGLMWKFAGVIVIYVITGILGAYLITVLSQSVIQGMRLTLSDKILKASFHKLEYQTKRLFTILTDDINTISAIIIKLPAIFTALATVIGCFGYMLIISYKLFGLFMIIFLIAFILYRLPLNSYAERMRKTRNHQNVLFGYFEGLIYGLKELSINKKFRSLYTKEIIEPLTELQKKDMIMGKTIIEIFARWGEVILFIGIGGILFLIKETGISTYDVMVQFLTVTVFTIGPLSRMTRVLPDFKRINVALEQINSAGLDLEKEQVKLIEEDNTKIFPVDKSFPIISLQGASYSYYHTEEEKFFKLGPVNLDIKAGEVTFLIGGNGSGKSTLAKLLCGLYPPEQGKVLHYGKEVLPENVESFRDQFNVIFADFYLFNEIIHIPQTVIDEKAEEYLKLLELDKKVEIVDQKLTTTNLSTGQRKRLALLVSYLEDKPIYLFDEWAAGLDPYYKKIFYKKLIPDLKARGKTVFAITHDETYFDCADQVIMLKEGQLLDSHLLHDQLQEFFN
ncbi:MAG: cyclic peptide export ABC transporter [Cyclobacteriaceae bacterium]